MNSSNTKVNNNFNVVHEKAPEDVSTQLYTAYALKMEFLTPFLHTLKKRINVHQEEVFQI